MSRDDRGHTVLMDASTNSGGEQLGFTPGKLLLASLAGCTGMDVVSFMRKQKQKLEGLEVQVSAKRAENSKNRYEEISVKYILRGYKLSEKAIERAIRLSEQKYCTVGITIEEGAKIVSNYIIGRKNVVQQ